MRPTGETGVQSHFNNFIQYLASNNKEAICVTPFSAPKAMYFPVFGVRRIIDRVHESLSVWWYRYWHYVFLRIALRPVLAKHPEAAIYAQCPLSAKAALEVRQSPQQRVVLVVHFNVSQADEWADKGKIKRSGAMYRSIRRLEEGVLQSVDAVVFVSDFMRKQVLDRIPSVANRPYKIVPNFAGEQLASSADRVVADIVIVGTLEPRKNQGFLLNVLAACKKKGHRYTLTVIGDGPDRVMLEATVRTEGLMDQVRFLGFQRSASALMPGHKVYCHSAKIENLPVAIVEAFASGLPVVAGRVGGIPEMLTDGVEGRFWPLEDVDQAATILEEVLQNETERSRMSTMARASYEKRFAASVLGPILEEFVTRA